MSRVLRTPGALYAAPRQAAKRIEKGDLIVWSALPPDHGDIGNIGWWHHAYCADCAPEGGAS